MSQTPKKDVNGTREPSSPSKETGFADKIEIKLHLPRQPVRKTWLSGDEHALLCHFYWIGGLASRPVAAFFLAYPEYPLRAGRWR